MPAGITSSDSMFSVRETPWHGLGAVLERPPATIAEAIEASGLGWRVEREPIAVDRGDVAMADSIWEPRCEQITGYYATVRQDNRTVLGIVGERYRFYLQSRVICSRSLIRLWMLDLVCLATSDNPRRETGVWGQTVQSRRSISWRGVRISTLSASGLIASRSSSPVTSTFAWWAVASATR